MSAETVHPTFASQFPHDLPGSAVAQRERGRLARQATSRQSLGQFVTVDRDPVAIIDEQNHDRVPELVPLRHQRMADSLFAFFRGTAGLMANDLASQPSTETQVVICGDAHIGNFGLYASPERRIIFDLNDFDESAPGPWEWDVRRLVTSVIIGARHLGFSEDDVQLCALNAARSYREQLASFLKLSALQRHFASLDQHLLESLTHAETKKMFKQAIQKAAKRTSDRAIARLMSPDKSGMIRFVEAPPILTHVALDIEQSVRSLFDGYRETTTPDISLLLSTFTLTDAARRVVGVGSVGTNCFLLALTSAEGRGLVLQIKEALPSVISTNVAPNDTTPPTFSADANNGKRVVDQQRILQAFSDPFLGHLQVGKRDYYVRQFHDSKGSFDLETMTYRQFFGYSEICAGMLARAHSQSPWAHWISGYLGKSSLSDKAAVAWSNSYVDQAAADYQAFLVALDSGRLARPAPTLD